MPGDPACWSHLFYDDDNADEPQTMTKQSKASQSNGTIPSDRRKFLSDNVARIGSELIDFLRSPSVSARSEHTADTSRAAEWVDAALGSIGEPEQVYPSAGHSVLVGEWRNARCGTMVLIYGLYDVQPSEP